MAVFAIIGNSSIKIWFADSEPAVLPADASAASITQTLASAEGPCVAASVNPEAQARLAQACRASGIEGPLCAGRDFPTGVALDVTAPDTVGVDRILNAKAAFARAKAPCAAVDYGTAVSISVADARGRFVGGAILPGLALSIASLSEATALLPNVPVELPPSPLGRDTKSAMQSGAVFGSVGAVREIVERISAVLEHPVEIFLTGRDASLVKPLVPAEWHIAPALTLEGLILAYKESTSQETP